MIIAGFHKMTLLDYPDKIAALVFTQGCNFYCGYCHNAEMIPKKRVMNYSPDLEPESILRFLSRRRGLLDGVVISGGEPTVHEDLGEFIERIKDMGFLVKLDTNGSNPEALKDFFDRQLLDYVAMDIKQCAKKYQELVKNNCEEEIKQSIDLIKSSGVDYEFRSTILPHYHSAKDLEAMGKMIEGAKEWHLQTFRPLKTLDRKLKSARSFRSDEMKHLEKVAKKYAKVVSVR